MQKNKIALITGITGQDGSYLAELLVERGYIVHGIKRRSSSFNTGRIDHLYFNLDINKPPQIQMHFGDMTDMSSILRIINDVDPDEIYNLAAQSHVQVSFETPEYTSDADGIGVLRILEAIRILKLDNKVKFYQASTSEMFGLTNEKILSENSRFNPRSPYAVAKLFAHFTTINYRSAYNIFASNGILFNHESPRRGETFVTKKFVKAAVAIHKKQKKAFQLGNLDAIRDWGHAKDYVDGMYKILQFEKPDDWVLATGETCNVRDFTSKVFAFLGIKIFWVGTGLDEKAFTETSEGKPIIEIDKKYFRPNEVSFLRGDSTKAKNLLGWEPKYSLDMLIKEMIQVEINK